MPTRIIRDGILTSERVNALSSNAELFYRRLMSVADDHGRFTANLTLLRASCYPLKLDSVKEDSIKKHLAECVDAGLIVPYTVDGKAYLEMQDFGQRINGKSKFPDPSGDSRGFPADSRLDVCVVVDVSEDDKRAVARDELFPDVDPETVRDFRRLRAAKKAPVTKTAVDGIRREAEKAGLSMQSALATCCERGWTGFKADWMAGQAGINGATPRTRNDL